MGDQKVSKLASPEVKVRAYIQTQIRSGTSGEFEKHNLPAEVYAVMTIEISSPEASIVFISLVNQLPDNEARLKNTLAKEERANFQE